jgi:Glyoxalase/Bleomycin resistance protein/Dioxygenase superfamily
MEAGVLFACVPVADLAGSSVWYERFLGRPPDIVPNEHEVMWRIVEAGWLYLVVDPDRAGGTVVSMAVSDLERAVAVVEDRGVTVARRETVPGAGRKAWFADPDGNQVALIEVLEAGG